MRTPITALKKLRATRGQHPGLLLQRYLCEADTDKGKDGNPEEKLAVLQAAIRAAVDPDLRALYQAAYARWQHTLPAMTTTNELQLQGRLVVGLGTENVLETGIRLHHIYGLPLLPGSALKGLAAHYCHQVWGATESKFKRADGAYHQLLFGTTDVSGSVIFHDAWFIPDSAQQPLQLDVMTPHHPAWLDGLVAPSDFDSPTPVPFLSVAGKFRVAVSWQGPVDEAGTHVQFRELALECLRDALFHWGIGGKTSSGYGRFDEAKWQTQEAARQQQAAQRQAANERLAELANMTPIERSMYDCVENHPNKMGTVHIKLLEELRKPNGKWQSEDDRKAVAKRIKELMEKAKVWGKKDKDRERTDFIKRILGES